ncbi:uncharacterized protein I303_101340 [Kwoniella dejecticola CBS 10117]|uniref:SnoaL-like domain-containing protein n=1 Tax=Kwoniella dejecticola CBS 10117 TaxID=1296121 RepID=A0A1A6AHI6_9TREE|nr:uncharacterized protein I303_01349 [Kwoniella dejecticola CBS 10117]OBR89521.1 hypothetical protein I303_01349 [Kwoniella dejecticola CBS 10117]
MTVTGTYLQGLLDRILGGELPGFLEGYVHDDVEWMLINAEVKSSPLSGLYHGKQAYFAAAGPVFGAFTGPTKFELERSTLAGNLAFIELRGTSVGKKDGKTMGGFWCWILEFDDDAEKPKIKKIKEYMDSALAKEFIENNQ